MSPATEWTSSQQQAAPWAWSAASKGLSQAEGERQYIAGGGAIGHVAWREVYQAAFAVVGWREDIKSIPSHWTIPERMYETTGTDWGMRFNFIAEVEVWSNAEQRWETRHVQAQSDELLTREEWHGLVGEVLAEYPEGQTYDMEKGVAYAVEEVTRWARD